MFSLSLMQNCWILFKWAIISFAEMMSVGGDIVSSGGNGGASGGNVTTNISIPIEQQQQQSPPAQATNSNHSTQSHANAIQSKMSDILKRKAPPKRKSQTSSRSKTRNQEHHTEQSSSVMQELMSKASALGKLYLLNWFNANAWFCWGLGQKQSSFLFVSYRFIGP